MFKRISHCNHTKSNKTLISLITCLLLFLFLINLKFILISCEELPNIVTGPRTQTVISGQNITFECSTSPNNDSSLTINWQRNGQSIPLSKHRQTLIHIPENGSISTLHLDFVNELDEGVYQCTARNELGLDVSKPAKLSVQYGAKITGGLRFVYNVTKGTQVPIECNARGQPAPKIELYIDDQTLIDDGKEHYSNVFMQFNATNTTVITCRATNFLTPINQTIEDVRFYEIYVQDVEEPTEQLESIELEEEDEKRKLPNGYCAPYIGQICRDYVPKNSLVFYNVSDTEDFRNNINEEIVKNLWQELIISLQEPCRSAAEKLLCYYAFPQCQWTQRFPMGKPLCREDCLAIRESFCVREWALLEDNRQKGVYFKSRGHFRLPNCDTLPSHENSTDPEMCSHAELTTFQKDKATFDCIQGRGRFYQGTINITKNGLTCQRWDLQVPHAHNRPPFVFQEIWNSENYCRNAGGEEPLPWCYTTDPYVRWQHCEIPICETNDTTSPLQDHNGVKIENGTVISIYTYYLTSFLQNPLSNRFGGNEHPSPLSWPLGFAISVLILTILMSVTIFTIRHIRYKQMYNHTMNPILDADLSTDLDLTKLPSNQTYHCTSALLNPKLEPLEYPRNKIVYIRDIGFGAFGRVFLAKAPNLIKGEEETLVAVKVLRQEASVDMQVDFEREAILMSGFDHPNVVKLLGVCALGKPMCLLVEYMAYGDLASFLRSLGPANYVVRHPNQEEFVEIPKKMTTDELVNVAKQIASGMVYLSSKNFVHRDLATRNCLVNEQLNVKISDFGLSQRMIVANYYRADIANDALPIRWMPLEAILYGKFTTSSDVWSFGVVLWEIFSYALQPYYGLTHDQVICYLKEGNHLTPPETCPEEIYNLMKSCWDMDPSLRPTFQMLEKTLDDIHHSLISETVTTESHSMTTNDTQQFCTS